MVDRSFTVALYGMSPSDPWEPQPELRCPSCGYILPLSGVCLSPACWEAARRFPAVPVVPVAPSPDSPPAGPAKAEPEPVRPAPAPMVAVSLPPEVLRAALLALQACATNPALAKRERWQEAADALGRAMGHPDGLTAAFRLLFGEVP